MAATLTRTVSVTKACIKKDGHNSDNCPVWRTLAKMKHFSKYRRISVGATTTACFSTSTLLTVDALLHGPKLRRWIHNYDLFPLNAQPIKIKVDFAHKRIEIVP